MSIRSGNPLPVGNETPIGFVPKNASQAPSGDIDGSQFVIASRIMSAAAALIAVIRQRAEMLRMANCRRGDSKLPSQWHEPIERFYGLRLPETIAGIDRKDRGATRLDFQFGVRGLISPFCIRRT